MYVIDYTIDYIFNCSQSLFVLNLQDHFDWLSNWLYIAKIKRYELHHVANFINSIYENRILFEVINFFLDWRYLKYCYFYANFIFKMKLERFFLVLVKQRSSISLKCDWFRGRVHKTCKRGFKTDSEAGFTKLVRGDQKLFLASYHHY